MKFIEGNPDGPHILELTERNLQTLLDKLSDPASQRTLIDPDGQIYVKSVEGEHHPLVIKPVQDAEHYSDRTPGIVFMPTTGEYR